MRCMFSVGLMAEPFAHIRLMSRMRQHGYISRVGWCERQCLVCVHVCAGVCFELLRPIGLWQTSRMAKTQTNFKKSWKFCFDRFQAMQDICRALLGRKCLFGVSPIWSPQAGQDLNRFVVQFRYHLLFVVGYTSWPIRRATLWRHTAIYI